MRIEHGRSKTGTSKVPLFDLDPIPYYIVLSAGPRAQLNVERPYTYLTSLSQARRRIQTYVPPSPCRRQLPFLIRSCLHLSSPHTLKAGSYHRIASLSLVSTHHDPFHRPLLPWPGCLFRRVSPLSSSFSTRPEVNPLGSTTTDRTVSRWSNVVLPVLQSEKSDLSPSTTQAWSVVKPPLPKLSYVPSSLRV